MNIDEKRLITHPDDLIPGKEYSVVILNGGKARRVRGEFQRILIERKRSRKKPCRSRLVIMLVRETDILRVPWQESKDWCQL